MDRSKHPALRTLTAPPSTGQSKYHAHEAASIQSNIVLALLAVFPECQGPALGGFFALFEVMSALYRLDLFVFCCELSALTTLWNSMMSLPYRTTEGRVLLERLIHCLYLVRLFPCSMLDCPGFVTARRAPACFFVDSCGFLLVHGCCGQEVIFRVLCTQMAITPCEEELRLLHEKSYCTRRALSPGRFYMSWFLTSKVHRDDHRTGLQATVRLRNGKERHIWRHCWYEKVSSLLQAVFPHHPVFPPIFRFSEYFILVFLQEGYVYKVEFHFLRLVHDGKPQRQHPDFPLCQETEYVHLSRVTVFTVCVRTCFSFSHSVVSVFHCSLLSLSTTPFSVISAVFHLPFDPVFLCVPFFLILFSFFVF